jgi:hypothetical protein
MRLALVIVLLAVGFALAATGGLALISIATGWEIRAKPMGGNPGLLVPTDLDFALVFSGIGLALLGLGWLLGRKLR